MLTQKAIKAENNRQKRLNRQSNKEAAERTVIRKKAKRAYFIQKHPEREAILENLGLDLIETTMENDRLKEAINKKLAGVSNYKSLKEGFSSTLITNHQDTGNGN